MKIVLDACVLYPTIMREILLGWAESGGFKPVWSKCILDEWQHAAQRGGDATGQQAAVEMLLLQERWPKSCFDVPEETLENYWLPDENDRHVLATAVEAGAGSILTMNLKDFPSRMLGQHGLYVQHPDAFLLEAAQNTGIEEAVRATWLKAERISGAELGLRNILKRTGLPRLGRFYQDLSRND